MKNLPSRLLKFIVCNLVVIAIGIAVLLFTSVFFGGLMEDAAENRFFSDLILNFSMTAAFIIPFYFWFFLQNSEYRRFYLKNTEENLDIRAVMKLHANTFTKYELPIIFAISFVLALIPAEIQGKTGLSFLFISASFFVNFIPTYVFSSNSVIFQIIGFVCWDIYITVIYFICLRLAYRKWEKERIRKSNPQ